MRKKKKNIVAYRRNHLLKIAVLILMLTSSFGLFIAFQIGGIANDDPNPVVYIEEFDLSEVGYTFTLENNTIEFRNISYDGCGAFVRGNIISINGNPITDALYEDLIFIVTVHYDGSDDTSTIYIAPPTDIGELNFSAGPMQGRRFSAYLRSRTTGEQLSPQIPINFTDCQANQAQFNLIQVAEIP